MNQLKKLVGPSPIWHDLRVGPKSRCQNVFPDDNWILTTMGGPLSPHPFTAALVTTPGDWACNKWKLILKIKFYHCFQTTATFFSTVNLNKAKVQSSKFEKSKKKPQVQTINSYLVHFYNKNIRGKLHEIHSTTYFNFL